jgi:hypothetical protein
LNKRVRLGPETVSRADFLNELVKGRHLTALTKNAD